MMNCSGMVGPPNPLNPLENPRLLSVIAKLNQAAKHVNTLSGQIDLFIESTVEAGSGDFNAETRDYVFALRDMPEPWPEISVTAGDIVHNLRSALDHLAYQLVEHPRVKPLGDPITPTDKRQFPIAVNPDAYNDSRFLSGADPAARAIIKALQPFGNETHPLWLMNEMSRRDKHRLLVLTSHDITYVRIEETFFEPDTLITYPPGPLIGGAEIVRGRLKPGINPHDPTMDMGLNVGFGVIVVEPPGADAEILQFSEDLLIATMGAITPLAQYVAWPSPSKG